MENRYVLFLLVTSLKHLFDWNTAQRNARLPSLMWQAGDMLKNMISAVCSTRLFLHIGLFELVILATILYLKQECEEECQDAKWWEDNHRHAIAAGDSEMYLNHTATAAALRCAFVASPSRSLLARIRPAWLIAADVGTSVLSELCPFPLPIIVYS